MPTEYKPGDKVESIYDGYQQQKFRESDWKKAKKLGKPGGYFVGKAVTYLHPNRAYVVESITKNGGLMLQGFMIAVSPKDVRPSTKEVR